MKLVFGDRTASELATLLATEEGRQTARKQLEAPPWARIAPWGKFTDQQIEEALKKHADRR